MTRRSRAREIALQLLVWRDANPTATRAGRPSNSSTIGFRDAAPGAVLPWNSTTGVVAHLAEIDGLLTQAGPKNWRLVRMAAVDPQPSLRLRHGRAARRDGRTAPAAVVINEAIEVAPPVWLERLAVLREWRSRPGEPQQAAGQQAAGSLTITSPPTDHPNRDRCGHRSGQMNPNGFAACCLLPAAC